MECALRLGFSSLPRPTVALTRVSSHLRTSSHSQRAPFLRHGRHNPCLFLSPIRTVVARSAGERPEVSREEGSQEEGGGEEQIGVPEKKESDVRTAPVRKEEGSETLQGVLEEIRLIEWPDFGRVLGTTGVVLSVIAGSSVVLLTVNALFAEISDRVFAGRGIQDFF